jgi:hypothetical protein
MSSYSMVSAGRGTTPWRLNDAALQQHFARQYDIHALGGVPGEPGA